MPGTLILVLALLVVALVLGSFARRLRRDRQLTQPLASIAGLYGRFLLLYLWRLVREANSAGPFTPRAAAVMPQLGWVVIAADVLLAAPFKALLPVPALAGSALLTFARITRAGAAMEDEIKATI
jgi:hypothetical protein